MVVLPEPRESGYHSRMHWHPKLLSSLRRLSPLVLPLLLASNVYAQTVPPPPRLEPLPEPPPRAIGLDDDPAGERGIRLAPGANDRIEEFVIDGRRVIRVTNPSGQSYYLKEDLGDGTQAGQSSGDSRVRVPRWVIFTF